MNVTKNNSINYVYIVVQFVVLFLFLIMLSAVGTIERPILLLPLAFFVINLLFWVNYVQQYINLSRILVLILYLVRLAVLPFLYYVSGEARLYAGSVPVSSEFIQTAFYLMIYEYFMVQLMIFIYEKLKSKRKKSKSIFKSNIGYNFFPTVLFMMTVFVIAVYAFLPEVRNSFKNIFMLDEVDFTVSEYLASSEEVGSARRIIATLFSVVFAMLRILLPSYFLVRAKKKGRSGIFILLVSIILQFAFITSTFAQSIVAALTIILLFGHLYPKKKKFLFLMISISTAGIIALYFGVRYTVGNSMYNNNASGISYFSKIVSAYFTGIENVAGCFNVEKGFEMETALSDLIGAIPFNTTFFGNWEGEKFQTYFNSANYSYGQISPAIGSGYYHFGWIFAPLYTLIMLNLSMFYSERAKKDINPWKYAINMFCAIVFALGLVMYNESIAFSWYLGWGIFMFWVLKFTNKDEVS